MKKSGGCCYGDFLGESNKAKWVEECLLPQRAWEWMGKGEHGDNVATRKRETKMPEMLRAMEERKKGMAGLL